MKLWPNRRQSKRDAVYEIGFCWASAGIGWMAGILTVALVCIVLHFTHGFWIHFE